MIGRVDDAIAVAVDFATFAIDLGIGSGVRALVIAVDHAIIVAIEFASRFVDNTPGRRVMAAVLAQPHAIAVEVRLTAGAVDQEAGSGFRAVVCIVLDTVAVAIARAAVAVDGTALGRRATQVDDIGYAVVVAVRFTALVVDGQPGSRARTLVITIEHAVSVAVRFAAMRIDGQSWRRLRAAVAAISDAIAVGITFTVADGEGEIVDVFGEEGERVVAFNPLAFAVGDVIDQFEVCRDYPGIVEAREIARFMPHSEVAVCPGNAVPAVVDEGAVTLASQCRLVETSRVHDREITLPEGQHIGLFAAVVPSELIGIDVTELVEGQRLVDVKTVFGGVRAQGALAQETLSVCLQKDQRLADRAGKHLLGDTQQGESRNE